MLIQGQMLEKIMIFDIILLYNLFKYLEIFRYISEETAKIIESDLESGNGEREAS